MLTSCALWNLKVSETNGQRRNDVPAFFVAHASPSRDFVERPSAAEAMTGACVQHANFDARTTD